MRALRVVCGLAATAGLAAHASGHGLELECGRSSSNQLVIHAHIPMPIVMPVSIFGPSIPGYAMSEPEFHSLQSDNPGHDLFLISPAADIRFVLLSKDPGVEVLNDTGSAYLPVGGSYYIGPAPFDSHPIWTIPSATAGIEYNMSIKLIDLNGVYTDSAPYNFSFTPEIRTYYWDTNGATPGAGGANPVGFWNGTATNFNTDATGGGAGALVASPASADTVVFAAGSDASSSYAVTVTGTRNVGAIKIEEGAVTLSGGTVSAGSYEVVAGANATVNSNVLGSVTKTGSGKLRFGNNKSYTGGTVVQAGTLEVTRLQENNAVTIDAGATVIVTESYPDFTTGHPSGDDLQISRPSSLTIAAGGTLDLANNDLILDYTGASPIAAYEALVASAYNVTGDWQGDGITSSVAQADGNYVVAIADNASLAVPFGTAQGGPLFAGVDVDLTTILIKFTHRADVDLDGVITPNDSAIFGGNYSEGDPAVWSTGDMDYDGIFTPNDAAIFGGFYDEAVASLPEPACFAIICIVGLARLRRRRPGVTPV